MNTAQLQVNALLRNEVAGIVLGTVFLFVGLASLAIPIIRRNVPGRLPIWFGLFSGMYGARMLCRSTAFFHILPARVWPDQAYFISVITYLILTPALLFWLELSRGPLRRFLQFAVAGAFILGLAGIIATFKTGSVDAIMTYNNAVTIGTVLILAVINLVPKLRRDYLMIPSNVLAAGALTLAAAAFYTNFARFVNQRIYPIEPFAFGVFVFSLGYVVAEEVFANERRLVSIDNELAIARDIQKSILPTSVPNLDRLHVAAAYEPMTAVAGDFYDFIAVDRHRAGFLVADVSGHGVPAALIASMIKVAMHSVAGSAHDPAEILRGLNRILSAQLRGQFVSAAYLWVDTERRQARYSAAGHPPLLFWREDHGRLQRIESNGLLFGVLPDTGYPIEDLELKAGDRLLLYTDGLIEPENSSAEAFGDRELERVIRSSSSDSIAHLPGKLLGALRSWQSTPVAQQDDITLLAIEIL